MSKPAWNNPSADSQEKAETVTQAFPGQPGDERPTSAAGHGKTRIQYDILRGKIKVSDTFDAPLQDFDEYM